MKNIRPCPIVCTVTWLDSQLMWSCTDFYLSSFRCFSSGNTVLFLWLSCPLYPIPVFLTWQYADTKFFFSMSPPASRSPPASNSVTSSHVSSTSSNPITDRTLVIWQTNTRPFTCLTKLHWLHTQTGENVHNDTATTQLSIVGSAAPSPCSTSSPSSVPGRYRKTIIDVYGTRRSRETKAWTGRCTCPSLFQSASQCACGEAQVMLLFRCFLTITACNPNTVHTLYLAHLLDLDTLTRIRTLHSACQRQRQRAI